METRNESVAIDDSAVTETPAVEPAKKRRKRLSISVVNFCLDSLLLMIVVVIGWVSAVLRFVFPAATTADGWKLWGGTYNDWADIQFGCMCVLALGVLLHVMLHWNWVCSVLMAQIIKTRARIDESMQTIFGVGVLIALLHVILVGVIVAKYAVIKPPM